MRTYLYFVVIVIGLLAAYAPSSCRGADPRKPGPYAVGVRTEVFVDEKRECAVTGKPRTLVTEIWYPATEDSDEYPLNKFSDFWGGPAGIAAGTLVIGRFGGQFGELENTFKNVAHRDAKAQEGSFPLLVFSHGNGGLRHQNTYQAEYLASHGYVVVAPDHTGNAAVTVLPDQIVPYSRDTKKNPERRDDRPHDVSFLISQLQELNTSEDHWLRSCLANDQIGVFGHSFGGFTACRVMELDPRVQAILPMTLAGTSRDPKESQACEVPLLVILGSADRTAGEDGNALSLAYFEKASGPKYLLNFKDAGHYTFTEITQINPQWGDGIGVEQGDGEEPAFTFSDAIADQRITSEYSVAFFDTFVKKRAAAKSFLDQNLYPEELEYRRE